MITIKQIKAITDDIAANFLNYAAMEYATATHNPFLPKARVRRMWLLSVDKSPLCLCGVNETSLMGTGIEVWLMCCRAVKQHTRLLVRFLRRALRRVGRLYPAMRVTVEKSFAVGVKFATLFGFVPLRTHGDYTVYGYARAA